MLEDVIEMATYCIDSYKVSIVDDAYNKPYVKMKQCLEHVDIDSFIGEINTILGLMTPTRLLVFFFISGYLTKVETFDFKKTMTSIVKKLLFPYFLFSSIIFIPKHLIHGTEISLPVMLYEILGGFSSWFVAALAVTRTNISPSLA